MENPLGKINDQSVYEGYICITHHYKRVHLNRVKLLKSSYGYDKIKKKDGQYLRINPNDFIALHFKLDKDTILQGLEDFVEYHNYSRIHFTYQYWRFGDVKVRKKICFIPYLRFVAY